MTEDESRMVREMHNALMKPRPGEKEPLVDRMEIMSRDWRRMGWAIRLLFALLIGLSSIIAAWDNIVAWIAKKVGS